MPPADGGRVALTQSCRLYRVMRRRAAVRSPPASASPRSESAIGPGTSTSTPPSCSVSRSVGSPSPGRRTSEPVLGSELQLHRRLLRHRRTGRASHRELQLAGVVPLAVGQERREVDVRRIIAVRVRSRPDRLERETSLTVGPRPAAQPPRVRTRGGCRLTRSRRGVSQSWLAVYASVRLKTSREVAQISQQQECREKRSLEPECTGESGLRKPAPWFQSAAASRRPRALSSLAGEAAARQRYPNPDRSCLSTASLTAPDPRRACRRRSARGRSATGRPRSGRIRQG